MKPFQSRNGKINTLLWEFNSNNIKEQRSIYIPKSYFKQLRNLLKTKAKNLDPTQGL